MYIWSFTEKVCWVIIVYSFKWQRVSFPDQISAESECQNKIDSAGMKGGVESIIVGMKPTMFS